MSRFSDKYTTSAERFRQVEEEEIDEWARYSGIDRIGSDTHREFLQFSAAKQRKIRERRELILGGELLRYKAESKNSGVPMAFFLTMFNFIVLAPFSLWLSIKVLRELQGPGPDSRRGLMVASIVWSSLCTLVGLFMLGAVVFDW